MRDSELGSEQRVREMFGHYEALQTTHVFVEVRMNTTVYLSLHSSALGTTG